jgi:hypothetical protein
MRRLYVSIIFSVLITASLSAQTFGNEWIDYSQKYLKIKIAQDGIYRIDSTTLSNSLVSVGTSLSSIDPRNIQIFHNGQQEYIWVEGESDGIFNATDYIEFYGKRNDGSMDAELYGGSANQLNPYFSLYNDTSIYFLTWNNLTTNNRLTAANDTNFSAYTPAPYFTNREVFTGSMQYMPGVQDPYGITDPDFIPSEGYYHWPFGYGGNSAHALNSQYAYTAGGDSATIRFRVASLSNDWTDTLDNQVRISFLSRQFDTIYDGFAVATYTFREPTASFGPSTSFVVSSINPNSSISSGLTAVAWITLEYPHTFNMEARARFFGYLPDNPNASKSLLQMTNIYGNAPMHVYDLFNRQRITAINTAGSWNALVQNGNGTEKPFMVFSEDGVTAITSMTPVNGTGTFTDFSLQAADSVFVIVTNKALWSVAVDYKTYRSSMAGGSRNVVLADVDELYDQFAWGIVKDPVAIRHFANYMIMTYPSVPGHLLLIGKSIYGDQSRAGVNYAQNLVPTYGYPACDNSLTAGLNGTGWEPAIPTGRIAARDTIQARWYLDKVIDYENNTPEEWMKYVLHFGGGTQVGEQALYRSYLQGYEATIEDTLFGGFVQSYFKTSSSPIQINQSDSLRDRIEAGVSIMTFFGHASGTGFDQSTDDPATYNNAGKYPLLIANSCYAGDIHSTGISSSEAFTLLDQKGTIGYIASVGVGIPPYLDTYTSRLYIAIGQTNYGHSIGECIQWTINEVQDTVQQTVQMKATCYEMTLQGDPSVVINSFPLPDYAVTNADVWFDQETQVDSVTIYAKVTNLGRAVDTLYFVQLFRTFPNGDTTSYIQLIPAPKFRDTIAFTIPVDQQRGIGLNKVRVSVDHFATIYEMNENNNKTSDLDLLIKGSAIVPVYPYEFAVIPTDTITLKASTVNAMEPVKQYRFELDTTDLFNSPFMQSYTVTAPGGVITWQPNLLPNDSMVYFWRVTPDSLTPNDAILWRESSFQYIQGLIGWGQAHYFQFKNDGYQYVTYDRPNRDFIFYNNVRTVSVQNGNYASWNNPAGIPWNGSFYKINGATQHIFSCEAAVGRNGITVAVIDPVTGEPWHYHDDTAQIEPGGYYDCVGSNQELYAYDFFDDDSVSRMALANYIGNIPNGHHVLIYSQHYSNYQHTPYQPWLLAAFNSIGSTVVANPAFPDSLAFIVFGTKGTFSGANEVTGSTVGETIYLQDTIVTNWNIGFIESPVIGPAMQWGSFHWRQQNIETPDYDSVYVEVYGMQSPTSAETLVWTYDEISLDNINLGTVVQANLYPFIRLKVWMKDDTDRTPPQMDRWQVLYAPGPDMAVNPPLQFSFYSDTLQEGDSARLVVAIQNLTPWITGDSIRIDYWIVDKNHNTYLLPSKVRAAPLPGYAWFVDTIAVNTNGYAGANQLWLEVNQLGHPLTQLEQYHFNNILVVPFEVSTDKTNPLLDVTFDGVHILDGDIVSGKPAILVSLKDENLFLALNDTADFNVFLKKPSETVAQLIHWNDPDIIFTEAVLPNNSAKILFTPTCNEDGVYELIVQAKDRSNNQSGLIDYRITFEVVNKPSVTNVMNYPNPFSTSTRFVFTITGTEVPETFTIQIMTISGKVVREIDIDELGNIHIGRNVTDYAWDGKDEYGDQLANGVYLYRVITRLNGNEIEHRDSGADQFIVHGWGKMYLMR